MNRNQTRWMFVCIFAAVCLFGLSPARAQNTTAFTYHGQLRDQGTNANGVYSMAFKLYDAVTNGNQINTTVTNNPTLADGHFTVILDFGPGAFNGNARWLDIAVKSGTNALQSLTPRTQIMPVPYALYSSSAGSFGNGTWSASVGNYPSDGGVLSNVFGFFANDALVFGLTTNGVAVVSDFTVVGNVQIDSSLSVSGNVEIDGNLSVGGQPISSSSIPRMQVFNSSETFVVPQDVTRIMVEVWSGGGGGGGGGGGYYDNAGGDGGGAGGGGYAKAVISVTPGSNLPVTIGPGGGGGAAGAAGFSNEFFPYVPGGPGSIGGSGGVSSIGTVSVTGGTGGRGGGGGTTENSGSAGAGGAGGSAGGQPFGITGQFGQSGFNRGNAGMGFGGSAPGGGFGGNPGGDKSPGGGGSGGKTGNSGGSGAAGRVVVYY